MVEVKLLQETPAYTLGAFKVLGSCYAAHLGLSEDEDCWQEKGLVDPRNVSFLYSLFQFLKGKKKKFHDTG